MCAHTHTLIHINIIVARLGGVQLSITGVKTPKYYQLSINFTISSYSWGMEQKPLWLQMAAGMRISASPRWADTNTRGCWVPPAPRCLYAEISNTREYFWWIICSAPVSVIKARLSFLVLCVYVQAFSDLCSNQFVHLRVHFKVQHRKRKEELKRCLCPGRDSPQSRACFMCLKPEQTGKIIKVKEEKSSACSFV